MAPLTKVRPSDRGLLVVKPASSRGALLDGHRRVGENGSTSVNEKGHQDGILPDGTMGTKPWANQPWSLIETPSATQNITHPALHIANEVALVHNAMIRGLNSIYLQATHVRQTQDIVDLLFLTQSWTTWLLDHHNLKESTMLPEFEAVLGVPAGALALPQSRSPSTASSHSDKDALAKRGYGKGKDIDAGVEEEEVISFLLHRVYAYASATHKDPQAYNAMTLEGLLAALAEKLVPHLTEQIKRLVSMREMCFGPTAPTPSNNTRGNDIPGPLPIPMVTITRTLSNVLPSSASPPASPPLSPSSSTFSSASPPTTAESTPTHSPPPASLSLFPIAPRSRPNTNITATRSGSGSAQSTNKPTPNPIPASGGGRDMAVIDKDAKDRLARARVLLEADDRANKLTQVYLAADARASATVDRFIVLPMIVRLRDSTATQRPLSRAASSSSLSSVSSHGSGGGGGAGRRVMPGFGSGGFGGASADWPRLSIPAVHAIADTLSPRHAGAWRFLPCDVWGRPRELPFLGS